MWPSGSSGSSHSGHGGRPADMTFSARSANSRACTGRQEHPHRVGPLLGVVEHDRLVELLLGHGEQFDDDGLRASASQPSPMVPTRNSASNGVANGSASAIAGTGRDVRAEPAVDLVQQRGDALGEHRDLLLLQQRH